MPLCDSCEELDEKGKVIPPHDALELVDRKKHAGGMLTGDLVAYRCRTCGTLMTVDRDPDDDHAGWWVNRAAE